MVWHDGKLYVSHRDKNDLGVITALGYDGSRKTVVAGMPAQGDNGLTDLAIGADGRLYFGIGTATNSGIVGLDNWAVGWVRRHRKVHDKPFTKMRTRGVRMDSRNPQAGLFGPGEKAVTGPFQPFDVANQSYVYPPQNGKFNGAIYSVAPDGGDLRAEAWGIRLPRGLGFNHLGILYFTNNGMELRGTRPVKDDPDVLCKLVRGTWYGWPDYSADFYEITQPRFQPALELLLNTGYDALPLLVDQDASGRDGSGLRAPPRDALLRGLFPSQSGAAKLVMVPRTGYFERFHGSAIVALSGDRAPFATGSRKTIGPIGHKVQRVIVDNQQVEDFIRNTRGVPAHLLDKRMRKLAMERPADVKLGPDGYLYVLDMGRMEVKNGKIRVFGRTGKVFRLLPSELPSAEQSAGQSSDDGGDAPGEPDEPPADSQ
jgi:glucose/arabinose dehydrogenase